MNANSSVVVRSGSRAVAALAPARRPRRPGARPGRGARAAPLPVYRTMADGGSLVPPAAVAGAEWQPGVTPRADRLRPTLDGEPVPGALAASVSEGWVRVAPLEPFRLPRRGVVRLVPVGRACR